MKRIEWIMDGEWFSGIILDQETDDMQMDTLYTVLVEGGEEVMFHASNAVGIKIHNL
jgi:hypothetical protein